MTNNCYVIKTTKTSIVKNCAMSQLFSLYFNLVSNAVDSSIRNLET